MAHNEDSDPDDDDDEVFSQATTHQPLQMPHSSSTQLITPDQHGSLEEGGSTHYEVH
jgi:hypothetical protein